MGAGTSIFFFCLQEEIEDIYSISFSKAPESKEIGFFQNNEADKGTKGGEEEEEKPTAR